MLNHTTDQLKTCKKCGKTKDATEFNRSKSRRDRLSDECRACGNARQQTYRAANHEKVLESQRKRRKENPEKERESARKYREQNPEKERERKRKYQKQNPEKGRECGRKWRKQHPDKEREQKRKYQEQNPDKAREQNRRRRARKMQAEGSHTIADMRRQYRVQKGLCWWCLKPVKWEDRNDDHLIPLSKRGTNWPNNMVVSCAFCNRSKHDKMPDEFSGRLF